MTRIRLLAPAALALVAAAPQDAQTVPGVGNFSLPPSRPTATPTPPTPAAPVIVLPTPTPSPSPTPSATPRPAATPTPRPASPAIQATSAPTPVASPTPTPTPSPPIVGAPVAPITAPSPTPTAITPAPAPADTGGPSGWLILALLGVGAAIVAATLFWRRRREAEMSRPAPVKRPPPEKRAAPRLPRGAPPPEPDPPPPEPEAPSFWTPSVPATLPEPVVAGPPPAPPLSPPRARVEIEITPRRAGINLLSATAEIEVILRNDGDATATGVAIDVRLLNGQVRQDTELAALFAAAMGRPAVPPFDLEAGETRTVRAVATLPRAAITPMIAGGREIFVPLITVDARYEIGGDARAQTATAFAIGRVRKLGEKLVPFWLDIPPKMFETIAARPHAFSVKT